MTAINVTTSPSSAELPRPRVKAIYAGFWRRWWAWVIDGHIKMFAFGVLALAVWSEEVFGVALLGWLIYEVGFTAEGGTPGKRLLGLRVVQQDGSRVGVIRAFLRQAVIRPFSIGCMGAGVLWMLDERRHRTWHDLAAGTIVVRELPAHDAPEWGDNPPWEMERLSKGAAKVSSGESPDAGEAPAEEVSVEESFFGSDDADAVSDEPPPPSSNPFAGGTQT